MKNSEQNLVEKLLARKTEKDNRIDLNTYALGLQDMYNEIKANYLYSEEEVLALLKEIHFLEENSEEWFNKHRKQ